MPIVGIMSSGFVAVLSPILLSVIGLFLALAPPQKKRTKWLCFVGITLLGLCGFLTAMGQQAIAKKERTESMTAIDASKNEAKRASVQVANMAKDVSELNARPCLTLEQVANILRAAGPQNAAAPLKQRLGSLSASILKFLEERDTTRPKAPTIAAFLNLTIGSMRAMTSEEARRFQETQWEPYVKRARQHTAETGRQYTQRFDSAVQQTLTALQRDGVPDVDHSALTGLTAKAARGDEAAAQELAVRLGGIAEVLP